MPISAVELLGQVESKNKQDIVAEVSGMVETALMEPGDLVKENMVLANVKKDDFNFDVAKKRANLELALADLQLKQAIYERYNQLVQKNSLSKNELDIAKAEYLNTKARLSLAEIELEEAELNLRDTQIASRIEGFVVQRSVQVGAWVNQGDLLYQVVNIDAVTVKLLASEHDMKKLSVGQPIELWSEVDPQRKMQSIITRIGVEMDGSTYAYPIEVEVDNSDYLLKPGMSIYAATFEPSGKEPAKTAVE